MHTLKFVSETANALIIGQPGTGKSHIAKALAYQATLQGLLVRYVEADSELARFAIWNLREQQQIIKSYLEPDLLLLDNLFVAR